MALKCTCDLNRTENPQIPIRLQPNEVEAIQVKIAEFVKDRAVFFGVGCQKWSDFLGGFHVYPFEYNSMKYQTVFAAITAQGFTSSPALMEKFATLDAFEAVKLAKENETRLIPIQKEVVTEAVLRAKFSQNIELKQLLLSTGEAYLVVSTYSNDRDWGDGFNCTGNNKYGAILMQIRGELGGRGLVAKPGNLLQIKKMQLGEDFSY